MTEPNPGLFLVLDGIAGSGKSTLIRSAKEVLKDQGYQIFDLKTWSLMNRKMPSFSDIEQADILFTYEPTSQWIGEAIREEMSQTESPYPPKSLAEAFALDRQLLYRRIIIPALEQGKILIQDRSVTSSLIYQPITSPEIQVEDILSLEGNALALEYAPHHMILTDIPPTVAIERANQRKGLTKGVFQQLPLLEKVAQEFKKPWFKELFSEKGTIIHTVNTNQSQEKSIEDFLTILASILPKR